MDVIIEKWGVMVIWKGWFETVPCRLTLNTPFSALCSGILGARFTDCGLRVFWANWWWFGGGDLGLFLAERLWTPHLQPFVQEFSEHGLQITVCESPAWRFSCRENTEILGAHRIGAAISGPRIADKNFTDTRIFLKQGTRIGTNRNKGKSEQMGTNRGNPILPTPSWGPILGDENWAQDLFFSNFSGAPGISQQKSRDIPPKVWFPWVTGWVSRDVSNFLAPTPSCGRTPPHPKISGPKSLGLGSFFFPEILGGGQTCNN